MRLCGVVVSLLLPMQSHCMKTAHKPEREPRYWLLYCVLCTFCIRQRGNGACAKRLALSCCHSDCRGGASRNRGSCSERCSTIGASQTSDRVQTSTRDYQSHRSRESSACMGCRHFSTRVTISEAGSSLSLSKFSHSAAWQIWSKSSNHVCLRMTQSSKRPIPGPTFSYCRQSISRGT